MAMAPSFQEIMAMSGGGAIGSAGVSQKPGRGGAAVVLFFAGAISSCISHRHRGAHQSAGNLDSWRPVAAMAQRHSYADGRRKTFMISEKEE